MSDEIQSRQESCSAGDLCDARELGLVLEVLAGRSGMGNAIRSSRIQKLGLALAGYTGYIHPDRVQVIGGSEINFLQVLDPSTRRIAVRRLEGLGICCIVISKGLDPPQDLLEVAESGKILLLRSTALSSVVISRITNYLEGRMAPHMAVHGVLLDVLGLGILLLGPSGIGKSECALELILKGHRLVADDLVEIKRRGIDRLVGKGGQILKYHMELRGLGIIDIKELFGISATGCSQTLDLAVRLQPWKQDVEYDRLGLEQSTIEFLGVSIPLIEMPMVPGRNIAALVEVAARLCLLRQRGYQPSREFLETLSHAPGKPHQS